MQSGFGARSIQIAAFEFEFMLKMGVPVQYVGLWCRRDRVFQRAHLGFEIPQVVKRPQRFFEDGGLFVKVRNLIERSNLQPGFPCYGTRVCFVFSTDQFEKSRFTGAIATNETQFFGRIDLE